MEHGLELELPDADERDWLLGGLERLVSLRGYEQLVGAPVLLPEPEYFPDEAPDDSRRVAVLLRRLLIYAGMPGFRVRVAVYDNDTHAQVDHHGVGTGGPGAAAWFAGIEGNACRFGVERRELGDAGELIGTLGHEVAHAYRHHHAIRARDPFVEERLTDLTAVYLGFGAFLLMSSWSIKTGGYSPSGDPLLFQRKSRGYLSPAQIALLLGAQSVARAATREEQKAIAAALSPNHKKLYRNACRLFGQDAAALRQRLGVPDPKTWSTFPTLEQLTAPDNEALVHEVYDPDHEPPRDSADPGEPATRRLVHRGGTFALFGAAAPFLLATAGVLQGTALIAAMFGGGVLGYIAGRISRRGECSACGRRLAADDEVCAGCGARIEEAESEQEADAR